MTVRSAWSGLLLFAVLGGCAAAPQAPVDTVAATQAAATIVPPIEAAAPSSPPAAPFIDSPPIEPVPPPAPPPAREPDPVPDVPAPAVSPRAQVAVIPPPEPAPAPPMTVTQVVVAEPTPEEREFTALLADLQRYNGFTGDELRREVQAMTQAVTRARSDANRVRLAVLYTLTRQGAQDDQRALQLFDAVAKSNPASAAVRQLAAVLSVQVAERVRAVRDEQARSDAAIQKLEALRSMERSLLRDRVRSGGGGGGAGSGGGN